MPLARVFIVAGELSGDVLGAGLIKELAQRHPGVEFRGIGGPRMIAAGFKSLFPLDTLSVMGLVEVIRHLPRLLRVRRTLYHQALAWNPDLVIGIDAPDFNLGLERKLRHAGFLTVHYVSPSVWAWRQGRVKTMARSVDLMLTLLPFEADFYRHHSVPVRFVGHPLADEMPLEVSRKAARQRLGLTAGRQVIAALPGSRRSEVALMGPVFFEALGQLCAHDPSLDVLVPAASGARLQELKVLLNGFPDLDGRVTLLDGQASLAMQASDLVLLTSGTAALEAMLCHRAMLVAYRMAPMTHWLARRLVTTEWISLPNLIAQQTLVPELIQQAASPDSICRQLAALLDDPDHRSRLEQRFASMHGELRCMASQQAADALDNLVAIKTRQEVANGG